MEDTRENDAQKQDKTTQSEDAENRVEGKESSSENTAVEETTVEEATAAQVADQEMARMQQELKQANDMMLRLAAELDNYKKRVAKERESLIKYAAQDIIIDLLPVLDNFKRAIESADKTKDFDSFIEGIKMIYKQVNDLLEKRGVRQIEAIGQTFDPTIHEAVMQLASDEHPENIVVAELQKGYMLNDRVIRPSVVAVSKGVEEE